MLVVSNNIKINFWRKSIYIGSDADIKQYIINNV
jgi:hypothetical protein